MKRCCICRQWSQILKLVPVTEKRNVIVCSDECQALALANGGRPSRLKLVVCN